MKYESTILKRLIDTYGVVGNPRYISEIIKEFIVRGKERFPELFTYQADWLAHIDEFGLNPSYTVSYTGQSIYAPNTLERPVKSAILKGSTKYRDVDTGEILETFEEDRNLELVSVKMPVLTTVGANLLNTDDLIEGVYWSNTNTHSTHENSLLSEQYIRVRATETLYLGHQNVQVLEYDINKTFIQRVNKSSYSYTVPNNVCYIRPSFYNGGLDKNIMISRDNKTTYEPHKTNILTANEDVELRGIGDVRDTLDCITGEKVERIGEIVLDGSENWSRFSENRFHLKIDNWKLASTITTNAKADKINVVTYSQYQSSSLPNISRYNSDNYGIFLYTGGSGWCDDDVTSLKTKLQSNPITVQYELATESIKTVDLTILDQNGQNVKQLMSFKGGTHFNTRSSDGSLLPTVSVSVETDLEETLMVCSLEGNTI